MKWFKEQTRVLQIVLLAIPGVNYIVELFIRITLIAEEQSEENILGVLLAIFTFGILGWIDLVWLLVYNHLILTKN